MTHGTNIPRNVIILVFALPVAVLVGVVLATPLDLGSMAVLGLVLGVLTIPILLNWHYPLLVFSWNAAITVIFLPGSPALWMLLACMSLGLSLLSSILNREHKLYHYPVLTWPMVGLGLVVVGTAMMSGGMGIRSLGGDVYGGKKYFTILFAIIGYFALSCRRIPRKHANLYVGGFILSGLTLALGNFAYLAGPSFHWLFYIFPIDYVVSQVSEDAYGISGGFKFSRLSGVTWAGLSVISFLLVRCGLRGILDLSRPWATGLCIIGGVSSLFGGFRSIVVIYCLLLAVQFVLEGLIRTRFFPAFLLASVLSLAALIPLASELPLSVQRSLSVLPIKVNPAARADAEASTDWRLRMWKVILPEIPRYFFVGKGYTANASDYHLASESFKRGLSEDVEPSVIAGDYHNGPLSIQIPFGIWGTLACAAFFVAALKVLHANYRHGQPELRQINTFLYAYFIARLIFFVFIFGAISADIWLFGGLAALSVSVNHGIAKPPAHSTLPTVKFQRQPSSA